MPTYNKLVRDKILEIIESNGLTYNSRILDPDEILREVKEKMVEEAIELRESESNKDVIEELADILELVHTSINIIGSTYAELEEVRLQKRLKRGGFDKAIYLIDVEDE